MSCVAESAAQRAPVRQGPVHVNVGYSLRDDNDNQAHRRPVDARRAVARRSPGEGHHFLDPLGVCDL
jgi:hypothetical protein